IVKRLTKPLDEPERELRRLGRAAWRLQQNESLAIAERNLFDNESSSSNNTRIKPPTPPKTLHEHSHPNSSSFQKPIILPAKQNRENHQLKRHHTNSRNMHVPRIKKRGPAPSYQTLLKQNNPAEQVYLSRGDIYDDPSLLRFYQNDYTPPWGNNKRKEKGDNGLEWVVRSKFKDELANFMLKKNSHEKGI
nr:hypothetical protein [Tanacetum cinerariifolium]